jgi:multiple sugar transport system ATP-binding protein
MASISIRNLVKRYGNFAVIPDLNLEIADHEFVVFVGPSGCGKSTLLRIIAGLEPITAGEVYIGDKCVNGIPAAQRDIAMVFQDYALYPHMRVYDNMSFALELRGTPKAEIDARVKRAAALLHIEPSLDRKPKELSGGQRQRVAMGRAIVRNPKAFLFDEPLSNLDAALRVNMRLEISELHQTLQTTMVYVTHDQVEAMTMADKIVVLNAGRIEQVGSPLDLYRAPANLFVAGFIGSPKMNLIEGPEAEKRGAKTIGVRPEHLRVARDAGDWVGTVGVAEHLGSDTFLHIHADGVGQLTARTEGEFGAHHGERVYMTPDPARVHRFDASGAALH